MRISPSGVKTPPFLRLIGTAKQAAEKLRRYGERAKSGGCKTISQPLRIAPRASWCDSFFALLGKSSFSAACKAVPFQNRAYAAGSGSEEFIRISRERGHATSGDSGFGEASEGREALSTAGLETGATNSRHVLEMRAGPSVP